MVCCAACVAEPDAALGLNLLQIRPTIGCKHKWDLMVPPWSARKSEILASTNALRVSLRLIDGGRDILAPSLGLDNTNQRQPDEQSIVCRAAGCRPLRNGETAPFGWPRPLTVT